MMEGAAVGGAGGVQEKPQQQPQVERLNEALQQQLNLKQVKSRAIGLFKAISRILEELDVVARANAVPKWEVILGQFSMVNLELFNIVDDIKKVSKAFVVYPKNVNADNANVLPVMLSSKLLPEMEMDDNSKREQLLQGMQNLPISSQIDMLKTRIDMIAAACASAEKILADTRKAYFGTRQGPLVASTLDKAQAAKIQEQENLLRAAVNFGEGLRVPADQRQITSVLPLHLIDVLNTGDGAHSFADMPGMYAKSTPLLSSSAMNNQGALLQGSGAQLMGRSAASPSGPSFNNTSPLPYANSPSSGANMMNTPSPQQQTQQQQQRQRMQLPQHQQQILAQQQQQFRQAAMPGMGQQLHGQHAMQFSQSLPQQQFQSRQLTSGHVQNVMGQTQLNQGNQLNRQMNQFQAGANTALYNAAQTTPNSQMMTNISGTMPSQRMQPYTLSGTNPSRSHASQMMTDQMFNMGATNPTSMMQMQQQQTQQQHGAQGAFGNMAPNAQNLQAGLGAMQNTQQNHPNYQQQRPPNQ